MKEKSLCISCANNCADHAYELIKQLAEAGIYVQLFGIHSGRKSRTFFGVFMKFKEDNDNADN